MKELLTTKELKEVLKVTETSIYRWRVAGMPHLQLGRNKRYVLNDVLIWLKQRGKKNG